MGQKNTFFKNKAEKLLKTKGRGQKTNRNKPKNKATDLIETKDCQKLTENEPELYTLSMWLESFTWYWRTAHRNARDRREFPDNRSVIVYRAHPNGLRPGIFAGVTPQFLRTAVAAN